VRDIILKGELAFMAQSAPRYTPLDPGAGGVERTAVLASLGLETADLLPGYGPMVVSTGANGLMVPLRDAATVRGVEPDVAAVERLSAALDLVEYYVFSPETRVPACSRRSTASRRRRQRAWRRGRWPAISTTTSACAKDTLLIEQGYLMPRPSPSVLIAELDRDGERIGAVRVGGRAIVSGTREVALA